MIRKATLLIVLISSGAFAQTVTLDQVKSGMMLLRTSQPGVFVAAPAVRTDVHLQVRGLIVRGEVRQQFRNPASGRRPNRHLAARAITRTDPHAHHVFSVRRDSPGRTSALRRRRLGGVRWAMTCYMKTIYGILRTDETVIWFWITCWDNDPVEIGPVEVPLAA